MSRPKILLDPDDFDALHCAALESGGIGRGKAWRDGVPCCVQGHAQALDGKEELHDVMYGPCTPMVARLREAGLTTFKNDTALRGIGAVRVSWERYVELLNIDVKDAA